VRDDLLRREGALGGLLSTLPADAAERLLAEAIKITIPAGALVYREGETPRVLVVLDGLLRVFLRSSGRQVTAGTHKARRDSLSCSEARGRRASRP
jgi:hypothetical protein